MPEKKLTHEEFDRRVRKAMEPPAGGPGQGFSPGVDKMRQIAQPRRPLLAQRNQRS